jgi:hypothetical protein
LLPRSCSLPQMAGGSASALLLSRPARASLTLRPVGSLSRPRRPLSRGSSPASCPAKPLVSYRINRQFSGRNLPPLMIRAFGAHGHYRTRPQHSRVNTALRPPRPRISGIPSIRLGPSLKDHVEWALRRPSNPRKPAVANDLGERGLTRLRTQAFAYFLVE